MCIRDRMNAARAVVAPFGTSKAESVAAVATMPVGEPPGTVTTSERTVPSGSMREEVPVASFEVQNTPPALGARPQGLTRFASVRSASPDWSETRFVWVNRWASAGRDVGKASTCLLYTSDAADERSSV